MPTFDEATLLEAIRRTFSGEHPGVQLGIGDDAAIVEEARGDTVLASDMLVEGVDFLRDRSRPQDIGWKSIVVNVSDVAAMAASPRVAVVALGLPVQIEMAWVQSLLGGMREAADEYGLAIVGGDLSRAMGVVISVAIVGGVAPGRAVLRSTAQVGDRIVVTGSLGAAAGGLLVSSARIEEGARWASTDWGRSLLIALERPVARLAEAGVLASQGATAMIDLSDGFARDLHRLCDASERGARIESESIPIAAALAALQSARSNVDPLCLALQGGEDFELLATLPAANVQAAASSLWEQDRVTLTDVGEVTERAEGISISRAGVLNPLLDEGFDHFDD